LANLESLSGDGWETKDFQDARFNGAAVVGFSTKLGPKRDLTLQLRTGQTVLYRTKRISNWVC